MSNEVYIDMFEYEINGKDSEHKEFDNIGNESSNDMSEHENKSEDSEHEEKPDDFGHTTSEDSCDAESDDLSDMKDEKYE